MVLSVLCVLSLLGAARADTPIEGPYRYRWGDNGTFVSVADMTEVPTQGGDTLWIEVELPRDGGDSVLLPPIYTGFEAFRGDERIAADLSPLAAARAFHFLDLGEHADAHALRLRITSRYSKTGMRGTPRIGTRQSLIEGMLRRDLGRLSLIALFLLTAVAALATALAGVDRRAFSGFGIMLLSAACWTAFYTRVRDLLLPEPQVWLTSWVLGLAGVGVGYLLFIGGAFTPKSRVIRWLLRINLGVAVVGVTLWLAGAPPGITNPFLAIYRTMFLVDWLVVASLMIQLLRRGDVNARIYAVGMLLSGAFSVHDLLLSLGVIVAEDPVAHWGLLCLFVATGVVLERRLRAVRRDRDRFARAVAATARERQMLLRDLHDGLGRITTTISMLSGSDDKHVLPSIGELATAGSREIRTFMHGLDDGDRDWSELEAQVRLLTRQTAEACGGSSKLDVALHCARPPSAYLFVHVLRVLQEALTNALKNSHEPTIVVSLEAQDDALELVVRNDRVKPGAAKGVDRGAGSSSMRSRAEELGGTLSFEVDGDGAELRLHVPLPVRYDGIATT